MQRISFSPLILGAIIMLTSLQLSATQDPNAPSTTDQNKLNGLQPTLAQIRNVDPNKVPWGLNLCLVEVRGLNARHESIDAYDFSSRITLLQKHKAVAQRLSQNMADLAQKIKNEVQATNAKVDSLNIISKAMQKKKIEAEGDAATKPLLAQRAKLIEEIAKNASLMKKFADAVKSKTGLTDEEINALPDIEKWKEMKKTQCASAIQKKPQPDMPAQGKASLEQRSQWKRAEVPVRR